MVSLISGSLARQSFFQTGEAGFVVLDLRTEEGNFADLFDAGTAGFGGFGDRSFDGIRRLAHRLVLGLLLAHRGQDSCELPPYFSCNRAGQSCYTETARVRTGFKEGLVKK